MGRLPRGFQHQVQELFLADMAVFSHKTNNPLLYPLKIVECLGRGDHRAVQVEGHQVLPETAKSTKYEHVMPLLASLEQDEEIFHCISLSFGDSVCRKAEIMRTQGTPIAAWQYFPLSGTAGDCGFWLRCQPQQARQYLHLNHHRTGGGPSSPAGNGKKYEV